MEKKTKSRGKYTREAFETLCKDTGFQHKMDLETTEFHSKVKIHGICIYEKCTADMVERTFENLMTNKNMCCNTHTSYIAAEKTAKTKVNNDEKKPEKPKKPRNEYSAKTIGPFLENHKLELKDTIESLGHIDFNTQITAKCQVDNCKNYFTKAYGTLNKSKNFSCTNCQKIWQKQKRLMNDSNQNINHDGKVHHYDWDAFIKHCKDNDLIPNDGNDPNMTHATTVSVKCGVCNTQIKSKTFQSLVRNSKCKTCINTIIAQHKK